jgi:DNA-binding GntR family transcriptional regulator
MAEQYGVALMTVQKALAMLRDEHVIATFQGRGAFVADGTQKTTPSPEYAEITRQLGELRDLITQTGEHLDARLTALEQAAGLTNDAPRSRPQRG